MTLEATYTHPHIQEQMFQKLWEKPESQDIEVGGYSYKYSPSTSIGDRPGELKVERENYGEGRAGLYFACFLTKYNFGSEIIVPSRSFHFGCNTVF